MSYNRRSSDELRSFHDDPTEYTGSSRIHREQESPRESHERTLQDFEYPELPPLSDSHQLLSDTLEYNPELLQHEIDRAFSTHHSNPRWSKSSEIEPEFEDAVSERPRSRLFHSPSHSPLSYSPPVNGREDQTFEIPMITLDTAALSRRNSADLETGLYVPPSPTKEHSPASPSKISGYLARMSDRIAGGSSPTTPAVDTHPATFSGSPNSDESSNLQSSPRSSRPPSPLLPATSFSDVPSLRIHQNSSMESIHSESSPSHSQLNVTTSNFERNRSNSSVPFRHTTHSASTVFSANPEKVTSKLHGKSLGIFPPDSPIRQWCHKIMSHNLTTFIVMLLLQAQTILLSYRQWNPLKYYSYGYYVFFYEDYALMGINCIYTLEIAAKVIAYGLYDDRALFEAYGLEYPRNMFSRLVNYFRKRWTRSRPQKTHLKPEPTAARSSALRPNMPTITISNTDSDESVMHLRRGPALSNPFVDPARRGPSVVKSYDTFLKGNQLQRKMEDMDIQRAFLRSNWQRLDLISVACFWISFGLDAAQWNGRNRFTLFRALGCVRILRLCNLTRGTAIILRACESALPQLVDVGVFIACFWLIFGIIGVQSFKSSLTRHCVWTNPADASETFVNSESYCGSWLGTDGKVYAFLNRDGESSGRIKGYTCPKHSVCRSGDNPFDGTVNYDNIFQAMQQVFVLISVNTFSDIMYDLTESENLGAALFYIFGIFILTVWLMNIFTAIIVYSFKVVQMEEAEEHKRNPANKTLLQKFYNWQFNENNHSHKVRALIQRKRWLRLYYKFEFLFNLVIVTSLISQSFREYGMGEHREHALYRIEASCTAVLLAEIVLRLILFFPEWRVFFLSKRNCFDLFLAVFTSIIIFEPVKKKLGHAYYCLTVFQLARFYRVVLSLKMTSELWLKIMRNGKAIYDLTLFYCILLYLAGIITSRYFEGTVPPDDVDDVQFGMHTLPNAIMSLYVITSTENWAEIMYNLQVYAENTAQRALGSIILVVWFVVSNSVIMNIFIAVIAKSLEVSEEGRKNHQLRQFIEDMTERLQTIRTRPGWIHRMKNKVFKAREEKNIEKAVTNLLLSGSAVNDFLDSDKLRKASIEENPFEAQSSALERLVKGIWKRINPDFGNPFFKNKKKELSLENFDPATFATQVIQERRNLIERQDIYLRQNPNFNTVLFILGPRNRLRRICQKIVRPSYGERIDGVEPNKTICDIFTTLMFLFTIGIVVTACYMTPIYRNEVFQESGKWNWTFYIDTVFVVIFTIEFLIKVFADGWVSTPNAYLRSPWNALDFCALLSLWIELGAYIRNDGDLSRIVRGIKALRALRILTISETAKNNFHYTMLSGFGKIRDAALISLTLLLPYSIWALNIFNGRLGYCLDGSDLSECVNEYANDVFDWEIMSPNVYAQPYLHMDSFSSSFSAFYQIVSFEGWVDLLINVMQSTGIGTPQKMFASPLSGIFICLFNFVSTVFILTLFVSVIISNYARVTGRAYLTEAQKQWYHIKKYLLQVKPSRRQDSQSFGKFRKFCHQMTVERNHTWHKILNFVLVIHVLALLLEAFPSIVPSGLRSAFFLVASSMFLINYGMLFVAQGYKEFIVNKWNICSGLIAFGAWLSTILAFGVNTANVFNNFNKLFLVLLLMFIFPRSDRINQLLKFASASFPALFSLMFTWFVMFIMYAIAMNQIFGMTKIGPNTSSNINLRSVPKSLVLLFRCSFGEGWNYIMDDFLLEEPFCTAKTASTDSDCGNKQFSYLLFVSWNILSMYIMLNLFVSLILDSFSYIAGGTVYSSLISRTEIRKFKRVWLRFDPEGTGFIDPSQLGKLLHELDGALSFHFYTGVLSVPELTPQWIIRNNPHDPYDITVDYDEVEKIMSMMDVRKIREKRQLYLEFMEEALMNMSLHDEPGISFSRLLVQIPLYNSFDTGKCLVLIDYLESRLLHNRIKKSLQKKRCYELIEGFACRWRYKKWKRGEMSTEELLSWNHKEDILEEL